MCFSRLFYLTQNEQKKVKIMEICSKKAHIRYKSIEKPTKNNVNFYKINGYTLWWWKKCLFKQEDWVFWYVFSVYYWCLRPQTMDPISGVSCFNRTEICLMVQAFFSYSPHFFLDFSSISKMKNFFIQEQLLSEPVKWIIIIIIIFIIHKTRHIVLNESNLWLPVWFVQSITHSH